MRNLTVRKAAFCVVGAMPLLLILFNALDVKMADPRAYTSQHCVTSLHESVWMLMVFAGYLATTRNPFRAIAACLGYLPIGGLFSLYPCTPPLPQLSGGLIYILSPVFVLFVIATAFIGGAVMKFVFDDLTEDRR